MRWVPTKRKLREWVGRYGVAEVLGTIGALGGAEAAFALSHHPVVAAYGGAMGENLGFYGTMILRTWRHHDHANHRGWTRLVRVTRALIVEFGPAELLDTGLTRPLAMGLCASVLGREAGTLLGKLVGDLFFYVPVIISYELARRRKHT